MSYGLHLSDNILQHRVVVGGGVERRLELPKVPFHRPPLAPLANPYHHQVEGGAAAIERDLDADVQALGLRLRRLQVPLLRLQLLALLVHADLVVDLPDLADHDLVPGAGAGDGGGAGARQEAEAGVHLAVGDDEGELGKLVGDRLAPCQVLPHSGDEPGDPPHQPLAIHTGAQPRPETDHALVLVGGGVAEALGEVGRVEVGEVDHHQAVGLERPVVVLGRGHDGGGGDREPDRAQFKHFFKFCGHF